MFPDRMDAPRYFGNRYFGPGAGGGGPVGGYGGSVVYRRYRRFGRMVILFLAGI